MRKRTTGMTLPEKVDFWVDPVNKWSQWEDDCLIWLGKLAWNGYGCVSHTHEDGRKHHILSRLVCIVKNGEPPAHKDSAEHTCGRRACINPKHLYWGSTKDNNRESRRNRRQAEELQELNEDVKYMEARIIQLEHEKSFHLRQKGWHR